MRLAGFAGTAFGALVEFFPVVAIGSGIAYELVIWFGAHEIVMPLIVSALEGAVLVGAISAFGAGLVGLGVPKNSILQYETAIKAGEFLTIAHGSRQEADHAKAILANAGLPLPDMHCATGSSN